MAPKTKKPTETASSAAKAVVAAATATAAASIPAEVTKIADKAIDKKSKKKKGASKPNTGGLATYVYRVLKQVHPDMGIKRKSMNILESFLWDVTDRIALEAKNLAEINDRSTINSRDIQTAVRLIMPQELAKHAVSEGTKAVTKYNITTV